jgi:hypothetical protein
MGISMKRLSPYYSPLIVAVLVLSIVLVILSIFEYYQFNVSPFTVVIVTLIGSLLTYLTIPQEKRLAYRVLASRNLVSVNQYANESVLTYFRDKLGFITEYNIDFVSVELANYGMSAIKEDDFARPIRITFGDNVKIIDFFLYESYDGVIEDDIRITLSSNGTEVFIDPFVLNRGRQMVFLAIVANYTSASEVTVKGLIRDGKIELRTDRRVAKIIGLLLMSIIVSVFGGLLLGCIYVFYLDYIDQLSSNSNIYTLFRMLNLLLFAYVVMPISVVSYMFARELSKNWLAKVRELYISILTFAVVFLFLIATLFFETLFADLIRETLNGL